MKHTHLTAADRGAIEVLLKKKYTQVEIAKTIVVDKSTVSREIKQRSTPKGYIAWVAQIDYEKKRKRCRQKKKMDNPKRQAYVTSRLQLGWSPEQISGRLEHEGKNDLYVCKETIYQWLYEDGWAYRQESLYQYLRLGRKKRMKHNGRRRHRGKIPNRVSIHKRPEVVEKRNELGHWEGDSVIYPHKEAINTINELTSGLVAFTKIKRKTAILTAEAMSRQLEPHHAKTLTLDNGTEFTNHEDVQKRTGVKTYFCDPYSSWQRGANENVNMLLRGYLPKRKSIKNLTQGELDDIAGELNNRPRKRHGFQTPIEVYNSFIIKESNFVALDSRM